MLHDFYLLHGIATPRLQVAAVFLDRLFLAPEEFRRFIIRGDVVCVCIREINRAALHELVHLCGCKEPEAEFAERFAVLPIGRNEGLCLEKVPHAPKLSNEFRRVRYRRPRRVNSPIWTPLRIDEREEDGHAKQLLLTSFF